MITTEDITKVAHLARLDINEQEKINLTKELDNILHLINEMKKVDVSQIAPLAHPLNLTQPLRKDEITETNQRTLLQQNAPQVTMGLFLVPPVIESEE